MSKIVSSVLATLPSESQEEFIKRCTANTDLFKSFAEAFKRKLADNQSQARQRDKYELASWACYQADSVGYQRALDEVIKILEFKE